VRTALICLVSAHVLAVGTPSAAAAQGAAVDCVVLSFGPWVGAGHQKYPVTAVLQPSVIRLTQRRVLHWPGDTITSAADVLNGTGLRLDRWEASAPDSLTFTRSGWFHDGVRVRGRWISDTLSGRALALSDGLEPRAPRAEARGIRVPCVDSLQVATAEQVLREWRRFAAPDQEANTREFSADSAWFAEILTTGRLPRRP
jgi:hypothetical protein